MNLGDGKKNYLDMAIKTFFVQENGSEADYKKVFRALAQCFSSILPQGKLYRYRSNLNWKHTKPIIENNEGATAQRPPNGFARILLAYFPSYFTKILGYTQSMTCGFCLI